MKPAATPLLEIRDLHVSFAGAEGTVAAVRGVDLKVGARERVAIVGESGSGKSVSCRAVLGLLPASASLRAQRMHFDGRDLLATDAGAMRALRGSEIAMIVQDPRQGLDPLMPVGRQLAEMLKLHRRSGEQQVLALLAGVHIRDPQHVARQLPHELSGGMAQRVMIAMMLAAEPKLLIADEATSALDAVLRERILELIDEQVRMRGMGLVLISHDLELVARFADRIVVMYGGKVMEELVAGGRPLAPAHPYTRGLLACRPSLDRDPAQPLPVLARDPAWLA